MSSTFLDPSYFFGLHLDCNWVCLYIANFEWKFVEVQHYALAMVFCNPHYVPTLDLDILLHTM